MNSVDERKVVELIGREFNDRLTAAVRETVRDSVKEAVTEAFKDIGIDLEEPLERQEDFIYLRKLRRGSELVKATCITTCAGAFITAVLYLLGEGGWVWIKSKL